MLAAALALSIASPAPATHLEQWRPLISEASRRFGVPADWIREVIQAESRGRTLAISPKGAMGLMQLMPQTWSEMREALFLGRDPFDPRDNVLAGTYYLRLMYERFGYPGLFAAYNAGPARYADHLVRGRPLPRETRAYVAELAGAPAGPEQPSASRRDSLFFPLSGEAGER